MFKRILKELNGTEKVIFIIHKLIILMILIFCFKYVFIDYLNIFSIELNNGILIDLIYITVIINIYEYKQTINRQDTPQTELQILFFSFCFDRGTAAAAKEKIK